MKKISSFFAVVLLLVFTSCSLFTKTKPRTVPTEITNTHKNKTENCEPEKYSDNDNEIITDEQLEGEWAIYNVNNEDIDLYTLPFLQFETSSAKIYGNTGCNFINGLFYTTRGKDILFENLISTMKMCENTDVESLVMGAIRDSKSYKIENKEGINHLYFLNNKGEIVLRLKSHNLNVLNGVWQVSKIGDDNIHDSKAKLIIDIQEGKLHGNSGCNIINGKILLDSKKDNSIQFERLISTRKACPHMQIETALLVALEEVEYYKKDNNNKIEMFNNKGHKVLVLKRTEANK